MKRFPVLLAFLFAFAAVSFAQEDFRNPDISAAEEDGAVVYNAATTEDLAQKMAILDEFFERFSESKYLPYALFTMLITANEAQQFEKALAAGQQLLEIAPEDLEVRHRVNQALVGLARWDDLGASVDLTHPLAAAGAAAEDGEYASGVLDFLAWASNTALVGETDPAKKIAWLDRLNANYSETPYGQNIHAQYVQAYQQAGDNAKMIEWMQKAIDAGIDDESYRYSLAEDALNRQDNDAAQAHADRALEILETKEAPPGLAPEQWEAHKTRMTAYANFAAGRAWVGRNTKPAYRTGRTHLLEAAEVISAEGGPRHNVLAYFLGVCYVQLDIQGDNIRQASRWMGEAANTPGPFQDQAKQALAGIQAAQ